METIVIPEGFELRKVSDTEYQIVQVPVEQKEPEHKEKTWEEFGELNGFYVNASCDIFTYKNNSHESNRNTFPTTTDAEWLGIAMPQLLQWRLKYIGDWKPDWNDEIQRKWVIVRECNVVDVRCAFTCFEHLSFPTQEMAKTFYKDHKSLIDKMLEL